VVLQEVARPGLPFHDHPVHWRGTSPRKGAATTSCSAAFTIAPVAAPPDVALRTAAATVHGPTPFLHEDCGLVSAYHAHRNLRHGHRAGVPTYRHLRKATLPWHIDYCFLPAAWRKRLTSARVVEGDDWLTPSDHSPVVVDLVDSGREAPVHALAQPGPL